MDRGIVKMLRELLQQVVDEALEDDVKERFSFRIGNASYTDMTATFKLEVIDKETSNGAESKEEADFKSMAHFYGLKESHLGKKFYSRGEFYKVTGIRRKSRRYPILVERIFDKKKFRMPAYMVLAGLNAFKSKSKEK